MELPDIVPLLVAIIRGQSSDSAVRKNALGALQKFSLRSMPQTQMLKAGIISWISGVLKDTDSLSDYTLEYAALHPVLSLQVFTHAVRYAMATLMNLSLRHDGKVECEAPSLRLLESLCDILEHENMQVRTYVNGTLYSLLTRQAFKDRAHALGLPEMLHCLADVTPPPPAPSPLHPSRCSVRSVKHPCRSRRRVSHGSCNLFSTRLNARCLALCISLLRPTSSVHRAQAVDDDSTSDDVGDEENDEPVSRHCFFYLIVACVSL